MAKAFVANSVEVYCPPLIEGVCVFNEITLLRGVIMGLVLVMTPSTGERWLFPKEAVVW